MAKTKSYGHQQGRHPKRRESTLAAVRRFLVLMLVRVAAMRLAEAEELRAAAARACRT
jgi:hypothetical protein